MRLPFFIAFRYLFSRKKINAINIINGIAMVGFGVGAFAMVVILSAFNGFELLVQELINNYDPDIKITSAHRKVFNTEETMHLSLASLPEVKQVSEVLEEKVVIKFNDRQEIARIKGVDESFYKSGFDSLIVMGSFDLGDTSGESSVFGAGLSAKLGIFPGSLSPVTVFVPRRDQEYNSLNPTASLSMAQIQVNGLFIVHEEIDNEVFISNLAFAQKLLEYENSISAYELDLKSDADRAAVKRNIERMIGPAWEVKTREEQNELIYKIFKSEKWFTYAILALVLLISAFNIFGSLIMLVLDKKKDISVLKSMGANRQVIRQIFLWQGSYISLLGGSVGLFLGVIAVVLQQEYGLLKLQQSIVDHYPVDLRIPDLLVTFVTIVILGYIISLYPASKAGKVKIEPLN